MNTSTPPTVRALPAATPVADHAERTAFGLDAIRDENRRLIAFGFELLTQGAWEVCPGDVLDVVG